VVLASLAGAGWTLWERQRQDPWLKLLAMAAMRLQQAGIQLDANSPPRRMAQQLVTQRGAQEPSVQAIGDWLLRLEALRYAAPGSQRTHLATLQHEFKQLRWPM